MAHPPFDAVLLDLDGTLVATERYWVPASRRAALRTFAELGLELDVPEPRRWLSLVGGPLVAGVRRLFPELDDAALALLLERCREEEEALIAGGGAALLPGVADALDRLRAEGVRLGIASNCGASYLERVWEALELGRWFDEARTLDSAGVADKADMVADLLLAFGTRSAVMVGDRATDAEAARANGLPAVHVRTGYAEPGEEAGVDLVLESLDALPEALQRRTRAVAEAVRALGLSAAGARSVGVTGRRAAGKTLFARDLARRLEAEGRDVRLVPLEAFRREEPPNGASGAGDGAAAADPLAQGFDVELLVEGLLRPHRDGRAVDLGAPLGPIRPGDLLVLEGPFLLDARVATHLARVLYLEAAPELCLARIAGREGRLLGPGPVAEALARDAPLEEAFERRFAPGRADLVVDARPLGSGGPGS